MAADRRNYQFGRHGSHLMAYHSIYSQLGENNFVKKLWPVALLIIPVAKFTRSVTLQLVVETYCKDWDSRF
jgi:hypothetical protein